MERELNREVEILLIHLMVCLVEVEAEVEAEVEVEEGLPDGGYNGESQASNTRPFGLTDE